MTTDVVISPNENNVWDLELDSQGDLANEDFFDSSLSYSLLGERRASSSEVPVSQYRRGWIGNENSDFENGSKLWLYEQSKLTRTVMSLIQSAALECLQWLVDDGYLVKVETSVGLRNGVVILDITLFRFNSMVERRFFELWNNTGAR